MKEVLNLYAGIGGNRKLWPSDIHVTAVENVPEVAAVYQKLYPQDTVIVGDAHEYLRLHFQEFQFIWASPPCPTHSRMQNRLYIETGCVYPDCRLWQEIIFLKRWYKGDWVVENVKPYYTPFITPYFEIARHLFWSNHLLLDNGDNANFYKIKDSISALARRYGFDIKK